MFSKNFFVTKLNNLMQEQKLRKQALAEILGISRQAVSKIANGINMPTIDNLVLISDYFNVSVDYLIGRSDDPQYEYYLKKSEDNLLLNMPEPFIKLYKYAKVNSFKNEEITNAKQFELLRLFQEWKDLYTAKTDQINKESAHKDTNKVMKLQKLERHLETLLIFNPCANSGCDQAILTALPDRLIEYLYQIAEDDGTDPVRQ